MRMGDKNLVGLLGIYRGACPFYRIEISDLSKKLEEAKR